MNKIFLHSLWLFTLLVFITACSNEQTALSAEGYITSLSLSSDGQYVISASGNKTITLWDLNNQQSKNISNSGNLFSAYFIKGTKKFLWQDLNNIVHITDIDGSDFKSWSHFPTYGHVMSSKLDHYYSADADWNIYHSYGDQLKPLKMDGNSPSFLGSGKLINLQLSHDNSSLLSSGVGYEFDDKYAVDYRPAIVKNSDYSKLAGVVVWDTEHQNPIRKLTGNLVKTFATFSPDGHYVVSGDENGIVNIWDIKTNKLNFMLASIFHGRDVSNSKDYSHLTGDDFAKAVFDKTGLIPTPPGHSGENTISVKFISNDHFLRFFYSGHYVAIYHIDNDMPLKYFDLGDDPFPSVKEYYRNVSIDTAPEAGILVTGQHRGSGINVYKFDKENLTLEKIWVTQ